MNRIQQIQPADRSAMEQAQAKWDSIAKPLHSLGLLEEAVIKIAGITGDPYVSLTKRCVVDYCADNGVVCEGVTQSDSSVTSIVAKAMADGTSNINRMAMVFHADVFSIDIGMQQTLPGYAGVQYKKVHAGTNNIRTGPAMRLDQAEKAIITGIEQVRICKECGYQILVTGEMGIGNTTTSSAIAAVLLDQPVAAVTGTGAGLDAARLQRKIQVIQEAIAVNQPDRSHPIELLAKLGGYDIAGMVGLYLGGAIYHMPIVIDGFISAVAAALAIEIAPLTKEYMLCSHVSKEPAGWAILEKIGLKPLITAELCLGEGTGGVLLLPMLDAALSVYRSAHRFSDLPMERYVDYHVHSDHRRK